LSCQMGRRFAVSKTNRPPRWHPVTLPNSMMR
jgi:hypothetical protein